jgi:hypothetical protein
MQPHPIRVKLCDQLIYLLDLIAISRRPQSLPVFINPSVDIYAGLAHASPFALLGTNRGPCVCSRSYEMAIFQKGGRGRWRPQVEQSLSSFWADNPDIMAQTPPSGPVRDLLIFFPRR